MLHYEIAERIKEVPGYISNMKNPPEEFQLAAIKDNINAIYDINNPTDKVMLMAYGSLLTDKEKQLAAVNKNAYSIMHIKNPDPDIQMIAVLDTPEVIEYIKCPAPEVQIAVVKQDSWLIAYINKPDEAAQLEVVCRDGLALRLIKNPTPKVKIEAVKQNKRALRYIHDMSEQLAVKIVEANPWALALMYNPPESVQIAAVQKDVRLFYKILEPTDAVNELALRKSAKTLKLLQYLMPIEMAEKILVEKLSDPKVKRKYVKEFLECAQIKGDKYGFIKKYGSSNAKVYAMEHALGKR